MQEIMNRDLNELQEITGYEFRDKELFCRALTHSSYANEHHIACLLYTSDAADEL